MIEKKATPNDLFMALVFVVFAALSSFMFYLHYQPFHNDIIRTYSNNETFFEIDANTTRYVAGIDPTYESPFTREEKSHMSDVKNIIIAFEILFLISLISMIIMAITGQINLKPQIKIASIISIILGLILYVASSFFDSFFLAFHKIFFPQGNWMFQNGTLMIEVYREIFFKQMLIYIISTAMAVIIIIYIIIQIIKHYKEIKELEK